MTLIEPQTFAGADTSVFRFDYSPPYQYDNESGQLYRLADPTTGLPEKKIATIRYLNGLFYTSGRRFSSAWGAITWRIGNDLARIEAYLHDIAKLNGKQQAPTLKPKETK